MEKKKLFEEIAENKKKMEKEFQLSILQTQLEKAIEEENYEIAAECRDSIKQLEK